MAIVKTLSGALDVSTLPSYGEDVFASPNLIRISDDIGNTYNFYGTYTFDQNGPHGPVSMIEFLVDGRVNFTVTDIAVPIEPLVADETDVFTAVQFVLAGNDIVYGRNLDDVLAGGGGDDRIIGKGGSDTLYGEAGSDILFGGDMNDVLIGGLGADRLRGDSGQDTFVYLSASDSTGIAAGRDRILDFNHGEGDLIDLRYIDDNPFAQLSVVDGFSKVAGQLTITQTGDNVYLVLADLDGNGRADFGISVFTAGETPTLSADDFLL